MSKLLRTELKEIVKECLVEILAEGLAAGSQRSIVNEQPTRRKLSKKPSMQRSSHLDNIVYNKKVETKKKNIRKTVLESKITADPILNELLADTAVSTLQEQAAAEGRKGAQRTAIAGDAAARLMDQSSPEDLFGGSANKWAQLAFSSK